MLNFQFATCQPVRAKFRTKNNRGRQASVISLGGPNGQSSNNKLLNATDMSQKDVMKLRMAKTLLQPQAL